MRGELIITDQARGYRIVTPDYFAGCRSFPRCNAEHQAAIPGRNSGRTGICPADSVFGYLFRDQLLAIKGGKFGKQKGWAGIDGEVIRLQPQATDTPDSSHWLEQCGFPEGVASVGRRDSLWKRFLHGTQLSSGLSLPGRCRGAHPYCGGFVSAVQHDWIFGVQFHPEKSQKVGFRCLKLLAL